MTGGGPLASPASIACETCHGAEGPARLRRSNRKLARTFAFGCRSRHPPWQSIDGALRKRMEPRQLDARKAAELAAGLHNLDRRTEASIDAVADRLRSTLAALTRDHAVQSELRSIDGVASTIVPQYAPLRRSLHPGHGRAGRTGVSQLHVLRTTLVRDRADGAFYPTGGKLQPEAHALGADMLVAGAFGHPRLWEKMLGGVTQDLIARMSLPIFMSH
jgi:nucleotide-binding universal stress UspA family protein